MNRKMYMAAAAVLLSATANTQAQGLAEDFSSNPFVLEATTDNLGSASDGMTVAADGTSVKLRATTNNDTRGRVRLSSIQPDDIHELTVKMMLSSESQFETGVDGRVQANVDGVFFNDTQESSLGDENATGDTGIQLSIGVNSDGAGYAYVCFDRRNADGSSSRMPGTETGNGGSCTGFTTTPVFNTLHTLTVGYDKNSANVYAVLDGERVEYPITTGHFSAQRASARFDFEARGTSTVAVGSFHSAKTNTFEVDDLSPFAGEPVFRKPSSNDDISVVDGKLRLGVESDGSATNETNRSFRALGETDYVEAKLSLSSVSTLGGTTGFNTARLRNVFYNEAQDGGTGDDGLGTQASDVFSAINLYANEAGEVVADVVIVRADSGDYSASTNLSNDPTISFPALKDGLALNTEYLASIRLDKQAKQLIFKFDDAEYVYNIQTPIYRASFVDGAGVDSRVTGAGKTVIFVDDFRTDPNAKTSEEMAVDSGGGGSVGSIAAFVFLIALIVPSLRIRKRPKFLKR